MQVRVKAIGCMSYILNGVTATVGLHAGTFFELVGARWLKPRKSGFSQVCGRLFIASGLRCLVLRLRCVI